VLHCSERGCQMEDKRGERGSISVRNYIASIQLLPNRHAISLLSSFSAIAAVGPCSHMAPGCVTGFIVHIYPTVQLMLFHESLKVLKSSFPFVFQFLQ
jgi:hypothetical protein